MAENDISGPLLNIHDVPRSVEIHLRKWIDTKLSVVERDRGLDERTYARPASYEKVNLLEGIPSEDMSPTVIIVTRGDSGPPERAGRSWSIPLDLGVAAVTTSFSGDGGREVAGAYGAAILGCLLHRRNLDGLMNNKLRVESWDGVRLDDLPGEESRTRGIIRLMFTIRISEIVWNAAGPDIPDPVDEPPEPPPDWPTVLTTQIDVRKEDAT